MRVNLHHFHTTQTSDIRRRGDAIVRRGVLRLALRFGGVGVLGLAVNTVAFQLFYRGGRLPLLAASALAAEVAIVHNYLLNDRWTFGRSRPSWSRLVRFNLSSVSALAVNLAVLSGLVGLGLHHYVLANLAGVGAGSALNFGLGAGWVWRKGDA